ncbi:Calcium-binding protein 7 [Chelonia mydas]|uniref:Calcium-binding protein 7 n=1 Tax=Chelonia mydas TaxID=8469 RepID=M7AX36_CHEMY|nr:Calcium-binding protein 7 [Chelonia mydas]
MDTPETDPETQLLVRHRDERDGLLLSAPLEVEGDHGLGELRADKVNAKDVAQGLLTVTISKIREAFKVFDRDGNGFISKQELGTAMRSLGYMPNEVELEVIIQRLDMDGDGQVDFEEFVTLLGPKLSTSGIPEKFHGTDFDTVFWKVPGDLPWKEQPVLGEANAPYRGEALCDMQKLTVDELKRLLYDTFCEHLSMRDIENIIMTEEESHMGNAEECAVDVEPCSNQQIRQTCVRKSLICAFAIAFIISVMLPPANQVLRSGMK